MRAWTLLGAGLLLVPALVSAQGICANLYGFWVEGEEVVELSHSWEDNCAVDAIVYAVEVDGSTIRVAENVSAFALAFCLCPYSGTVRVGDLAPGDYTVIWDYDFSCDDDPMADFHLQCDPFVVTVPGGEPAGDPGLVGFSVAGCGLGDLTGVPDDVPTGPTWSTVRASFR